VGKWRLNKAQSKLPPGEVMPGDMVADFSRVDSAHVRWSVTVTDAQGRPKVQSFDTPANGEFYPVSGDTTAAFNLTESALQATFKGPAGETDAMTCVVSTDHRKMTCNGVLTGGNGKSGRTLTSTTGADDAGSALALAWVVEWNSAAAMVSPPPRETQPC
jgi:hypothetical protein